MTKMFSRFEDGAIDFDPYGDKEAELEARLERAEIIADRKWEEERMKELAK